MVRVLRLELFLLIIFNVFTSKSNDMVIGFMGDVMLGRRVNEVIDEQNSYAYPWGNTLDIIRKNDFNIINLETTLTTSQDIVNKVFNFRASPNKVNVLKMAGITVANLANNHILDFGQLGMIQTIDMLDRTGIYHVGAGKNIFEANRPLLLENKGIKFAIIGYTDNEPGWKATETKFGTNYIKVGDIDKVKKDIEMAKKLNPDFIIVTMHWGPNMRLRPNEEFKRFAHSMIDAGVDIIHGHSAHITQGIEVYKSKLIMYDTGDFIDDYAVDPILRNDQSILYLVYLDKKSVKFVKLVPIVIKHCQANLATGENYKNILERITLLSKELGTNIINDKIEIS